MRRKSLPHIKRSTAKGKEYLYFRTGQFNAKGKEILAPLPPAGDPGFGDSYASFLGARTKRERQGAELSVSMLIDLYERSPKFRKLSDGTQRLYGFGLAHLRKMLPTAPAALLDRTDIARLVDGKADTPGAANSLLRTINAMYRWARERGHVANDPGKDVPEFDTGEHQPWPQHVLDAALASDDALVRLATHLLYYTSLRIGDALALRWSDIRGGVIFVTPQKTKRKRGEMMIPVHQALTGALAKEPKRGLTIITGQDGKPLHQQTVRDRLKEFAAGLGVKVVPHGLRKNAVNALLECGCSVAETAAISGQTMATVEYYAKQRAQGTLASAAILRWERGRGENLR